MFKSVVWSSMLDFPGRVSTVLFVGNCNWKCAFCHNAEMFRLPDLDFENYILPELLRRKSMVDTVVVSGGEPSVYGDKAIAVIKQLSQLGFTVGLHTNGSKPSFIENAIPFLSFIGMDIKTSPDRYQDLVLTDGTKIDAIVESLDLIVQSKRMYEFRTTMYPGFVTPEDAIDVSNMLAGFKASKLVLQQYRPVSDDSTYSEDELKVIQKSCAKNLWTELRGV